MVWKAALIGIAVLFLPACDDIRGIEICKISWLEQSAECAKGSDESDKKLEELDGWYAVSETDLRKIASKLEECERRKEE